MAYYKIKKYDKFFLTSIGRHIYVIHVVDNSCPDIKIGDEVEIENEVFIVENMEWFEKSFHMRGDNVSLLLKEK